MKSCAVSGCTEEQNALLYLLDSSIFHVAHEFPADLDWETVMREASQQAVLTLAYKEADEILPAQVKQTWRNRYLRCLAQNVRITDAHAKLHMLLTNAGIPYVILKGCASAAYYPKDVVREMGDVDFLVDTSNRERVHEVLLQNGFCFDKESLSHQHHWTYTKDGITWELHWEPSGVPRNGGVQIRRLLENVVSRSVLVKQNGTEFYVPTVEDHGVILLLHTASHLTSSGMGMRHLLDWLCFVNSCQESFLTEKLRPTLETIGLWRFAEVLTETGSRIFSACPCGFLNKSDDLLCERLIQDILAAGNMGVKDENRLNQAKLLRNEESRQVGRNGVGRNLISFLNLRAKQAAPFAKKVPILLPVGWGYVGVRHLVRVFRGKRPRIHLDTMVTGAVERKDLYSALRLYETEEK